MTLFDTVCVVCQKPFLGRTPNAKICSPRCAKLRHGNDSAHPGSLAVLGLRDGDVLEDYRRSDGVRVRVLAPGVTGEDLPRAWRRHREGT